MCTCHQSHPLFSVKTNNELWADFVPDKWNKGFGLELIPSADDGESNRMVSSRLIWRKLNAGSKVYFVVDRSSRCHFYKPEFDAVLRLYVELKKTNRAHALSAYKKDRKEFVRQSFVVRAPESPVPMTRLLTPSEVWPRRGYVVEAVFGGAQG